MYQALVIPFGLLLYACYTYWTARSSGNKDAQSIFWTSLPTVGVSPNSPWPWFWATLGSITKTGVWVAQGYSKFSKKHSPFALPRAGYGVIVVLPPSLMHLLNKSQDELIAWDAQIDVLQPKYMTTRPAVYDNPIHFEIVRKHLTKDVGQFASLTAEELDAAFLKYWGDDTSEWKTANIWDTCTRIISQASNRAFIELPLCRNETLLEEITNYAASIYQGAALISSVPRILKPIFGHLFSRPVKGQLRHCQKLLVPMVEERLKRWDNGKGSNMPNDALQWMIQRCSKLDDKAELEPGNIVERLLNINIVSSWTTAYAFTWCILDLYHSRHKEDYIAGMRAECESVARDHGGLDSKEAIDKLYRVDSAVKESLRLSPFSVVALPRIVAPGNGLEIDGYGRIPPGTRLSVPFQGIQHDPDNYEDPLEYDAFRFSRQFEGPKGATAPDDARDLSVLYSEKYLAYGYGKHACPGRWFASQMLKQALSYIVQNYEVEVVGSPTERIVMFNTVLPDKGAQVRIRRRSRTT